MPLTNDHSLDSSDEESLFSSKQSLNPQNLSSRLHIKMDDWKWRHARIFGADHMTQLFDATCHLRSPHLRLRNFSSSSSSETHDTASMHTFSCDIDLSLQGKDIKLKSRGAFKDGWMYDSPALGERLSWRSDGMWDCFTLVCKDEAGTTLARGSLRKFSMKTAGAIEILSEKALEDPHAVHEFVLFAMAVMQYRITYLAATGYGYYVAAASSGLSKAGSSKDKKAEKDKMKQEKEPEVACAMVGT